MAGIHYPLEGVAYCEPSLAQHYFQVGAWVDRTFGQALAETARRLPDKLALISDDKRPWAAHPSIWAPFTVVGAGAELPSVAPIGAPGKSRPAKAVT